MKVEVYRLKTGGEQDRVATCRLWKDEVVFEGDPEFIEALRHGIVDRRVRPPKLVLPEDGKKFLETLSVNLHSGYLEASGIIYESESSSP